jgi:hypothetical protein
VNPRSTNSLYRGPFNNGNDVEVDDTVWHLTKNRITRNWATHDSIIEFAQSYIHNRMHCSSPQSRVDSRLNHIYQCIDFTQVDHRICNLLWHKTGRAHVPEILYPMSLRSHTFNQCLSKHDQNMSSWTSFAAMFWLRNQWDLISSLSLSTSNDFSRLLSMTRSPSVILSLMSPFSETDYWIWWWNSLQLGHAITSISRLPSDGILARSS